MAGIILPITTASARTAASKHSGSDSGNQNPGVGDETGKFKPISGDALPPIPTETELTEAVAKLNDAMKSRGRQLRFHIDDTSGRTIIVVVDSATGEIVRQIPPEETLALSRHIDSSGVVIDAEA